MLNQLERYEDALQLIMERRFHPWEGGEGKVTAQYIYALRKLAQKDAQTDRTREAERKLRQALVFPKNLGEGKLDGQKDNDIHYDLGCVLEEMGRIKEAQDEWVLATEGEMELTSAMYYNDQPAELIYYKGLALKKLGRENEALATFQRLIDYGEAHLLDEMEIDYFAVSLPNLQIFEEDLSALNRMHCEQLITLGRQGESCLLEKSTVWRSGTIAESLGV